MATLMDRYDRAALRRYTRELATNHVDSPELPVSPVPTGQMVRDLFPAHKRWVAVRDAVARSGRTNYISKTPGDRAGCRAIIWGTEYIGTFSQVLDQIAPRIWKFLNQPT